MPKNLVLSDPLAAQMDRWATAIKHPLRIQILHLLMRHGECSATSMADELGADLDDVAYHVRVLFKKCEFLELVWSRPARGAEEKFYRLKPHSEIRVDWPDIPEPMRSGALRIELKGFTSSAIAAIEAETVDGGATGTFDCWVATFDEPGVFEVHEVLAEAMSKIEHAEKKSRRRLGRPRTSGIQIMVGLAGFKHGSKTASD